MLINTFLIKLKALKLYIYLLFLVLLIIVPLSIKGVNAFSKDQASADKMINDNKEYAREIEVMKIKIELLKKEIETSQNKRYIQSSSHNSYKPQSIYTIQTGSYLTFAPAEDEFNSLMKVLTKKYRSFLRVEKVGTFHAVRLGKFENYSSAEKFIKSVTPEMPKTNILNAFLKYDRLRICICY